MYIKRLLNHRHSILRLRSLECLWLNLAGPRRQWAGRTWKLQKGNTQKRESQKNSNTGKNTQIRSEAHKCIRTLIYVGLGPGLRVAGTANVRQPFWCDAPMNCGKCVVMRRDCEPWRRNSEMSAGPFFGPDVYGKSTNHENSEQTKEAAVGTDWIRSGRRIRSRILHVFTWNRAAADGCSGILTTISFPYGSHFCSSSSIACASSHCYSLL